MAPIPMHSARSWLPSCAAVSELIGVLRPPNDADGLMNELAAIGLEPVSVPLMGIELLEAARTELGAVAAESDRWIVCPSANSVRALVAAAPGVAANVAVIGSGTEAVALAAGITPAHVAPTATADALARTLPAVADEVPVLVPQSTMARPTLVAELRRRGMAVTPVDAYRPVPLTVDDRQRSLLERCVVHCVTAPSVLEQLANAIDLDQWTGAGGKLVAIGPTTAAAITEGGWPVAGVAEPHNNRGLAVAARQVLSTTSR